MTEDQNEELLMRHANEYFEGTRTKDQLFELLHISLQSLSKAFASATARGALTLEEVGMYQWASVTVSCVLRVLEHEPQYNSPLLERQLRDALRLIIKAAPRRQGKAAP